MIYYFCPNHDVPSWGIGMLYYHISFLNKNGIEAFILHNKKGFKLSWLSLDVPIKYIEDKQKIAGNDILVVPDFYVEDKLLKQFKCRKILFVQNSFILFERIKPGVLNTLGYECVFYYMPHLEKIMSTYFNGPVYETPPFIAEYYFKDASLLHNRNKEILIYPKSDNRDYNVLKNLLDDTFKSSKGFKKWFLKAEENAWKIIELKNLTHEEVANKMKTATFFICLNTHEAFNSSVPEAMAAGCINLCYDAFGTADLLIDKSNAFVFNNNHVFPLFQKLLHYVNQLDDAVEQEQLRMIRETARQTADQYSTLIAEEKIIAVFKKMLLNN